jgi:CubicO group peptidase (beta-lactamase class C family)
MFLDNDGPSPTETRAGILPARASARDGGRVLSQSAVAEMLKEQTPGWGLGWSLPEGLFLHEGSSGTVAWADPKTGVIGILFLQYRDQNKFDERLRKQFRETVRGAFRER